MVSEWSSDLIGILSRPPNSALIAINCSCWKQGGNDGLVSPRRNWHHGGFC
jgi:hypothetical protein